MRVALAIAASLALASPASGYVTIGSNLQAVPNDNLPGYCGTICTGMNLNLPATAAGGLTAPIDGVVVKWRIRSGSSGNPLALRVLHPNSGTTFTGAGTSDPGETNGDTAQFDSRVKIKQGESIGVDAQNSALIWSSSTPGTTAVVWGQVNNYPMGLPDGTTGAGDSQPDELLLQAVIEADADDDGFGDETQDACPSNADRQDEPCETGGGGGGGGGDGGGGGPGNPPDTTKPLISGFAIKPAKFRVGKRAVISGSLSEASTLTLKFNRLVPGRVKGGKCVQQTSRVRTGKTCTAHQALGSIVRTAPAGPFSIVFRGKISGRARPPGRYVVSAVAVDAAGNRSARATAHFRLKHA
jgi:hypothetical protein